MKASFKLHAAAALVLSCVALVSSSGVAVSTQFHAQDGIGQYSYGYSGGPSAKTETKTADGVVRGQYSYIDAHGIVQTAVYVADPVHGFRVAATNDPAATANHAPLPAAPVYHAPAAPVYRAPAAASLYHLPPGVDTPEVQVAKAAHFQAVAEAKTRNAHASYGSYYPAGATYVPYAAAHSHPAYYTSVKDTPEVAAAKSAHFAAVHEAKARAHQDYSYGGAQYPYSNYAGGYYSYYVPVPVKDTPEVAAAKSAHFAAVHEAKARAYQGYSYGGAQYPYSNYAGGYYSYYVPVPVKDTPEVAAAKAAHFAAVHEAKARTPQGYSYGGAYYPYAAQYASHAPVPVKDTPEVAAAKAAHYAAVNEAKSRTLHAGSYYPYASAHNYYAPLPVGDTPEVAAAKAAHFAAVHEAKARNNYAAPSHYGAQSHYNYAPLPVTDTPEVAHAKAAHLAAVHQAKAQSYGYHGW